MPIQLLVEDCAFLLVSNPHYPEESCEYDLYKLQPKKDMLKQKHFQEHEQKGQTKPT